MTGGEIAAIIAAVLGGFTVIGGLIMVIVNARTASINSDMSVLKDSIDVQHKSDLCVIETLRDQVNFQGGQIRAISNENNQLHAADNAMRLENNQLSIELEAVRQENRELRVTVTEQSSQIRELQNENALLRSKNMHLEALTVQLGEKLEEYRSGRKKQTGSLKE